MHDSEKRQGSGAMGSSRRRSKAEANPKGKARIEHEKPEGRESQEGRGAGVISPITQATALGAGRKPLKSRVNESERATAGSDAQRQEGKSTGEIRNGSAAREKPLKEKP